MGQALPRGQGGDGQAAKTVETRRAVGPDAALAVLHEARASGTGKALRRAVDVGASLVDVHQAHGGRRDPQPSVPIAEHVLGLGWRQAASGRKGLQSPLDEPPDSDPGADQQRSVLILVQAPDAVELAGDGIEGRRIGFPSPDPGQDPHPEVPLAILVQARDQAAQPPVLALARDVALPDRTKPSGRIAVTAGPHDALTILEQPPDPLPGELRVLTQLAVLQAREAVRRTDPESPVARREQTNDAVA